jgi:methyl-accepting chemotaxis protein
MGGGCHVSQISYEEKIMRIRGKAVLAGVVAVVGSIAIATIAAMFLIRTELIRQANVYQDSKMKMLHELLNEKGPAKVVNGKLLFGDYVVNNNFEIVDKLSAIAGGTATIFLGDTRVATTVLKEDGNRAVGTPLVGVAKDIVINRGMPYRGEADILGVPYFTAYDPIVGPDGRPFGVLYVGVKQVEFMRAYNRLLVTSIAVAIILALIAGALVTYGAGRLLGRVVALSKAADAVSIGEELDTPLTSSTKDEIGDLARSIDRLRESMRAALKRLES